MIQLAVYLIKYKYIQKQEIKKNEKEQAEPVVFAISKGLFFSNWNALTRGVQIKGIKVGIEIEWNINIIFIYMRIMK